jgi:hypothetical protein
MFVTRRILRSTDWDSLRLDQSAIELRNGHRCRRVPYVFFKLYVLWELC